MNAQAIKFFWIGEESEKFAAESIEQIQRNFDKLGDYTEDFAEDGFGEIEPTRHIRLRKSEDSAEVFEGTIADLAAQLIAEGETLPFMISTVY
jgi:hypothetical protein